MILKKGEVRQVGIEVINCLTEDFVIEAADYTIIKEINNQSIEVETGIPIIDKHKILVMFDASEKGTFYVWLKYHIGPEIYKAKILVEVV
ncbi:MAG: hypothetical protein GX896_06910 [Clostridiales bacterium]|nr:hypothetical protein [Clostridiales bacterium]